MIREVKESLETKVVSQKKISKCNPGVDKVIELIDYVNNVMAEDDVEIWPGHTVEEVLIPREFADFVYPSSIRYNSSDRRTNDLRVRKPKSENKEGCDLTFTYGDYINACSSYRGNFKKDATSDMVSIASLRKHVNLADVIDRVAIKEQCNYYAGNYVPIPVCDISVLFSERYLNDSAEAVLKDYLADLILSN